MKCGGNTTISVLTDFVTPPLERSCLTSLMNQFFVGQSTRKCCRRFTNGKLKKLPVHSVTIKTVCVEIWLYYHRSFVENSETVLYVNIC